MKEGTRGLTGVCIISSMINRQSILCSGDKETIQNYNLWSATLLLENLRLYTEGRGSCDRFLGLYLSLRSIQHQIIELAEDALLQLVPGDTPVLVHEKRRAKPEEEEQKEEVDKEDRRKNERRLLKTSYFPPSRRVFILLRSPACA